jgi:hypothetical protein
MGPGQGRYVVLGALLAVAGGAALGAVRADAVYSSAPRRSAGISPDGPAPADAAGFLTAVSGTPPTACALVVRTLGNRWGSNSVRPRLRVPLGESPSDRALAEWSWSARPTSSDTEALLSGLAATDPCARRVAATLLAQIEDGSLRDRLRRRVESSRGAERLAALIALTGRDDPASAALLRRLLGDADVEVRRSAAWGLGEMESRASRSALETALRDADVGVRVNAAWALGRLDDPAAIPALSALLGSDSDTEVRSAAAWALGKIED